MMNWSDGYGWMGMGWIFMVLFWVLVIVGVIAIMRQFGVGGNGSRDIQRKTPLEILQVRYAQGEIGREEYEQKRSDLER